MFRICRYKGSLEQHEANSHAAPYVSGRYIWRTLEIQTTLPRNVSMTGIPDSMRLAMLLSAYTGPLQSALECVSVPIDKGQGYKQALAIIDEKHRNETRYFMELVNKVWLGSTVILKTPDPLETWCTISMNAMNE